MQANNPKAIKAQAEAIKALSTRASKAKLFRPKIPKASAWHAGNKMATKHLGPRIGIKRPGSRITKLDSKVTKSATKVSKPDLKATKSGPKATKSDAKAAKSDPKAAKSDSKAVKYDSKVAKSDCKATKPAESKPKDAGAKAPSPKPSK
ncbi:histone H1.03-like [Petaurus breviceps papuanus]|uniref:histone H1.03-like n=1 Tax=Petaurus breviceps papuanus TaxID=3040969 RepID=UPI0036DA8200